MPIMDGKRRLTASSKRGTRGTKPLLTVMDEALLFPDKKMSLKDSTPNLERWRIASQRFILSDSASYKAGKITKATEERMILNHQFARPPHPVTYVEFNLDEFLRGGNMPYYDNAGKDVRVGLLSVEQEGRDTAIYVFSSGEQEGMGAIKAPFYYLRGGLTKETYVPEGLFQANVEMSKDMDEALNLITFLLGSSIASIPDDQRSEVAREFYDDWSVQQTYSEQKYPLEVARSCVGDVRNWIALMLLINQPKIIQTESVGRASGIRRGRRVVFLAHNIVDIELGRRKVYARMLNFKMGHRASPRRHNVRGHYIHRGGNPDCIHEWPKEASISRNGAPNWTCQKCGRLRTWRKAYYKGSAERGFATHDYSIR